MAPCRPPPGFTRRAAGPDSCHSPSVSPERGLCRVQVPERDQSKCQQSPGESGAVPVVSLRASCSPAAGIQRSTEDW